MIGELWIELSEALEKQLSSELEEQYEPLEVFLAPVLGGKQQPFPKLLPALNTIQSSEICFVNCLS